MERLLQLRKSDVDITDVFEIIRDLTMKTKFSRERAGEWDKMVDTSDENFKQVAAIAKKARQTANVARAMAYRAANKVSRRGKQRESALELANEAKAEADRAEAKAQKAETDCTIAEQKDNDVQVRYERLYETQAAAFLTAEVARQRLVQRAIRKTVLTAAAGVAKQKQKQQQQRQALAINAAETAVKRQQIKEVVEADIPAEKASRQPQEAADTAPAETAGDDNLCNKRARIRCNETQHVEFADVEIAEMICKLENGLDEIAIMELEHQKKLEEIQTKRLQNDIFIHDFQQLENFNPKTDPTSIPTTLLEPSPTRTSTHFGTVSMVRGCAASEGDREVSKRDPRGSQLSGNQEQAETIQSNSHNLKPPREPPPESYIKQNLNERGRQKRQLRGCRPTFGWNRGCKRDQIGSREGVLDIRISMHSGTGTNAGPRPNYGTCKRVSTGHETGRDTHGRLARRQARDQRRARLLSRQCYCRGHSAAHNLPPEHEIIPVRQ